jgi:hypothetical protein
MGKMDQLDLFSKKTEEKVKSTGDGDLYVAPSEVDEWSGDPSKWPDIIKDESRLLKIPPEMDLANFSPEGWLEGLIASKQHLIFLFLTGDKMCNTRCSVNWEWRVKLFVQKAVLPLSRAEGILRSNKYVHHSNYTGYGERAKVFVRWWGKGEK